MKIFKPSLTSDVKLGIGFFVFFWIFGTYISYDNNELRETINISLLTLLFCSTFVYLWLKQTYLVISGDKLKFVNFFVERKTANISDVKMITISIVAGFMKFLCIIHFRNGKEKLLQISPVNFSKKDLNEFIEDLKKINPQIEIHESAKKLIR